VPFPNIKDLAHSKRALYHAHQRPYVNPIQKNERLSHTGADYSSYSFDKISADAGHLLQMRSWCQLNFCVYVQRGLSGRQSFRLKMS
jgi:hypothetical protein